VQSKYHQIHQGIVEKKDLSEDVEKALVEALKAYSKHFKETLGT